MQIWLRLGKFFQATSLFISRDISRLPQRPKLLFVNFLSTGAISVRGAFFGPGNGAISYAGFGCLGNESHLLNCTYGIPFFCTHSEDAGVICPSSVYIAQAILKKTVNNFHFFNRCTSQLHHGRCPSKRWELRIRGTSGGVSPWILGHYLRWQLGQQRCHSGVQPAWLQWERYNKI